MIQEEHIMPNRTIYVADGDLPYFERAQELAGGNLSSAIAHAIRAFVEDQQEQGEGFEEVTVKVGREVQSYQRFQGRRLVKGTVTTQNGARSIRYEVYQTPKNNLAVYIREQPAWYQWSGKQWTDWNNWGRYDSNSWTQWMDNEVDYRLEVYPSLEELKPNVPPQIYGPVERIITSQSGSGKDGVEILDI